ncbi:MAG: xanthine dehydrogenase family protein molybdopterin-binding subunit [Bacilli bacterium]|nr:xanthine dehydrogenase family protein molybdopterin-binding subunit [Bacilli bacterium]
MLPEYKTSVKKVDNEEKMSGKALFTDDIQMDGVLSAVTVRSKISKGKILNIKLPTLPEGYYFISAKDIVKENVCNIIFSDWPVFADKEINYKGESIGLIVGEDKKICLDLVDQVVIEYEEKEPVFDMKNSAIHKDFEKGDKSVLNDPNLESYTEKFQTGYQEQVYLETQGMLVYLDGDKITVKASMQCPFYIHKAICRTLGYPEDKVRVIQPAVGGAFGGKEHYPSLMGAQLATALVKIKKPIKMVFDRKEDISFTTKRHPSETTISALIDKKGKIRALDIHVSLDAGAYIGCSGVVLSRALIAATNTYKFDYVHISGDAYITNKIPSAAFRGFGSPQSIFAIEMFLAHVAKKFRYPGVLYKNQYLVETGDTTSTNGKFRDKIILKELIVKAKEMSDYDRKEKEYSKPNSYRGIGMSYFLHGCGFTGSGESDLIKAKLIIRKDKNDIVTFYTSQVDFGQGNRTTLKRIVVDTLGIPEDHVIYDAPDTDKTLSTGPTAASRTIIIVGGLAAKAAQHLKDIWVSGKEQEIIEPYVGPDYIHWDEATMQGDAYPGYAWGVNVVEVSFDPITYEVHVEETWSVYDVGHAIDERILVGQADGGILQGLGYGYLEVEEMANGEFRQKTMSDYIVPTSMDAPKMHTAFIDNPFKYGAFGAKGAGELTFVGGAPAVCIAIEQAIKEKIYKIPANPEYLMEILEK